MATVDSLRIEAEVDVSGVTRGLSAAAERIGAFSAAVDRSSAKASAAGDAAERSFKRAAISIDTAVALLDRLGIAARIDTGRLVVAARDMDSVSAVARKLGADFAIVTEEAEAFGREAAAAAEKARRALTEAAGAAIKVVAPVERSRKSIAGLTLTSAQFGSAANRLAAGSVSVAFGLEALARGGEAADAGLRTALRSVASLGAAFGPKGLLVAGVAASTAAVIDLFDRAREEMEKTRKLFEEELSRLARSGDVAGLKKQMQDIFVGDPSKGAAKFGQFFAGGLSDLRAQIRDLENQIEIAGKNVGGALAVPLLRNQLKAVREQAAPLEEQVSRIGKLLREGFTLPRDFDLLKHPIEIRANVNPALDAMEELEKRVQRVLALNRLTEREHITIPGLTDATIRAYDDATRALERQADQWGVNALRIRANIEQLKQLAAVRILRLDEPVIDARDLAPVVPIKVPLEVDPIIVDIQVPDPPDFPKITRVDRLVLELQGAREVIDAMAQGIEDAGGAWDSFSRDALSALDSVVRVVDAIGAMRAAMDTMGGAGSLSQFAGGLGSFMGAAGLFVGAVNTLRGLLGDRGESPEARMLRDALERNRDAIERLTREMTPASLGDVGLALQRAVAISAAEPGLRGHIEPHRLAAWAAEFDVTIGDIRRAAERFGITIERNGSFLAEGLRHLIEATAAAREGMVRYNAAVLADVQALQDAARRIRDTDADPLQAVRDTIANFQKFGEGIFDQAFADVRVGEMGWEERLEEATRAVLAAMEASAIPISDFGSLVREDVTGGLLDLDSATDQLRRTTEAASEQLQQLNVPAGFKINLERWEATLAEPPRVPRLDIPEPNIHTLEAETLRLADVLGSGADDIAEIFRKLQAGDVGTGGGAPVTVNITVPPGTPDELARYIADAFEAEMRRRKLARSGSTARPYDIP